jgi:UDP-glucose 4-epimerase
LKEVFVIPSLLHILDFGAQVTGAAGFIGAHLVRELSSYDDCEVVGLDDFSGGFRENIPDTIEFVEGSVTDEDLIGELFDEYGLEYIYHLAAHAAEGLSHFIRRFNYENTNSPAKLNSDFAI